MADTIFGNTPFTSAMQGYAQGQDTLNYKEQSNAQTSLLSDKAELSRMNVKSIKDDAALKLQERNLEAQTLADNPELQVKTGQQRDSFLASLLTKQEVRSNPLLAAHIADKQKKNQLDLADSYSAKSKVESEQRDLLANNINSILVNPTNPDTVSSIDALSKTEGLPETDRRNLMGLKAIFSGSAPVPPTYWSNPGKPQTFASLSPNEQQRFTSDIQTHYNLAKNAVKDTVNIQDEIRKQARDAELSRLKEEELSIARQRVAASREGNKIKADKARDNSKKLADVEVQYTKNLNTIDQKQRKILQDNGVSTPDDQTDNWFFANTDKLPAPEKAAYESLTLEKQLIQEGYERAKAKLDSADETPPPKLSREYTKENPAQVKVKADVEKLPKGAFFRNPADGKIYQKDK